MGILSNSIPRKTPGLHLKRWEDFRPKETRKSQWQPMCRPAGNTPIKVSCSISCLLCHLLFSAQYTVILHCCLIPATFQVQIWVLEFTLFLNEHMGMLKISCETMDNFMQYVLNPSWIGKNWKFWIWIEFKHKFEIRISNTPKLSKLLDVDKLFQYSSIA